MSKLICYELRGVCCENHKLHNRKISKVRRVAVRYKNYVLTVSIATSITLSTGGLKHYLAMYNLNTFLEW